MSDDRYGMRLFPQHQKLLNDSAIDPGVALERGYVSVDQKSRLDALNFGHTQRNVPGLLIPVWGPTGDSPALHIYRPDHPRYSDDGRGTLVKYENPPKAPTVLDVHPRCRAQLLDPSADLIITEGSRKVDAAVSHDYVAVGLLGVDMWAKRNEEGYRTPLPDWKHVALKGRKVFIAFDSDVTTKHEVRRALKSLVTFLTEKGALVEVMLIPDFPDGRKCGLDDYLGAGGLIGNIPVFPGWDFVIPPPPPAVVLPSGTFPVDVLPNLLQQLTAQILLDVGPGVADYAAAGVLPVVAAALGRDWKVDVGGDWIERGGAIWLSLVGKPGVKKSPVMRRLVAPIEMIDKRLAQASKRDYENWMEDTSKTKGPRPAWLQTKVGDITMERLVMTMEQNPSSLLMVADELKGWVQRFNQYRGGDDRQKWLSFWVGANETIQRKGDALPTLLVQPTISIIGGIQPTILGSMFRDDGLAPRMLFALGEYEETETGLPKTGRDPIYKKYEEMIDAIWRFGGAKLELEPDAHDMANTIYNDLERKTAKNVDGIGQVHAKMEAYLFRFAGIFNGLDYWETGERGAINTSQIDRAFAVVEYFTETSRIVRQLDDGAQPIHEQYDEQLEALRRYVTRNPGVGFRQVLRQGPRGFRRTKDLEEALKTLGIELSRGG